MANYLVRRESFWRFVRRVPQEYADLDKRGIVQQSTKIRVADDPKAIRASQVANNLNAALERYWRDLAESDSAQAVRDYEAAIKAAKRLGISAHISAPVDDDKRIIAELRERIRKLTGERAEDRTSALAVYDAAPKPDITFRQCAERYIEAHRPGWSNPKHAAQWQSTLATYAYPVIGDIAVRKINGNGSTDMILSIWSRSGTPRPKRHHACVVASSKSWIGPRRRLSRGRKPGTLARAPRQALPAKSKIAPVEHHPALPYADVPDFMKRLRAMPGTAARALEFTILTAGRTDEVLGADDPSSTSIRGCGLCRRPA